MYVHELNGKGKKSYSHNRPRTGSKACETSRLPHSLDNRLTDGGALDNEEDSWYSFLLEAESTPGP
jgi:hypothetical protein